MGKWVIILSGLLLLSAEKTAYWDAACSSCPAGQVTVRGQVRDGETGEMLPGASVRIEGTKLDSENMGLSTSTNSKGAYSFTVPAGAYHLIAGHEGYAEKRKKIELVAGQQPVVDFKLAPMAQNYAYQVETVDLPPQMVPEISGIDFTPAGDMVVTNRRGEVWIRVHTTKSWSRFAYGLYEPFGVVSDMPDD